MYTNFSNGDKIKGVGVDITDISRFERLGEQKKITLRDKILTGTEKELFSSRGESYKALAVFFCVKEAVSKAFGTGFNEMFFTDIELSYDNLGKPMVSLSPLATRLAKEKGITSLEVSISHEERYVIAYVVAS